MLKLPSGLVEGAVFSGSVCSGVTIGLAGLTPGKERSGADCSVCGVFVKSACPAKTGTAKLTAMPERMTEKTALRVIIIMSSTL